MFISALPKQPTGVVVSEVTATSVQLNWHSGNTEPIEKYVVQYKPKYTTPNNNEYQEIEVKNTHYNIIGLMAYTKYEFRVVAVNNIGRSLPSVPVDIDTRELGMYGCSYDVK